MTEIPTPIPAAHPEGRETGETRPGGHPDATSGEAAPSPLDAEWRYENGWVCTGPPDALVIIADVAWLNEPQQSEVARLILEARETRTLLQQVVDAARWQDPFDDPGIAEIDGALIDRARRLLDGKGDTDAH